MSWFDDLKNVNIGGGGVNLNPFASSLYTGKGTPWGEGPQDPYKPQYKAFNAGDYQGMDTSSLGHALRQDIGQAGARAKGRMQGALQRSGGGADAVSGLAQLEAQQGQDEQTLTAKLAQQDYEQRYNQWRDMMVLETQKANADAQRYGREVGKRDEFAKGVGSVVGSGLGSIGGPVGSALGSKLANSWFPKKQEYGPQNTPSGF